MPLGDKAFKTAASAGAKSITQWPLLLVICGELVALLLIWAGHWRWGAMLFGGVLCLGAVGRLMLPRRLAGLLQVRSRTFDVLVLAGMGVLVMVLAVVIPAPRG